MDPVGSVRQIVVDCLDPPGLARFWASLLGGVDTTSDPNGEEDHSFDELGHPEPRAGTAFSSRRTSYQRFDATQVPWATFTSPEIGPVGMTEAKAADHEAASPTCR